MGSPGVFARLFQLLSPMLAAGDGPRAAGDSRSDDRPAEEEGQGGSSLAGPSDGRRCHWLGRGRWRKDQPRAEGRFFPGSPGCGVPGRSPRGHVRPSSVVAAWGWSRSRGRGRGQAGDSALWDRLGRGLVTLGEPLRTGPGGEEPGVKPREERVRVTCWGTRSPRGVASLPSQNHGPQAGARASGTSHVPRQRTQWAGTKSSGRRSRARGRRWAVLAFGPARWALLVTR